MLDMPFRALKPLVFFALLFSVIGHLSAQENEIRNVADTLSRSLNTPPKRTVAVVDFTDLQGNVTPLGRFVAAELESALANSGSGIDLVDRTRLQLLMQENKLASTGVIDPATARQLGKIAGVQVLITGTLTPLSDTVRLTVKALNTEDARIVATASRNILKTQDVIQLLNQGTATPSVPSPGPIKPGTAQTGPAISTAPKTQVVEEQKINFALKSCIFSGNSISCYLTLTNLSDDRNVAVGKNWGDITRLIDGAGREVGISSERLGLKERENDSVVGTLVSGVPTAAELHFEKVPSDVSVIALLEIVCEVDNKWFKVQFRKVPILVKRY
jgi:TolB-like protein